MDLPFKPGDRVADIRLGTMGGSSVALSDYAGRKKLVYVWASWCGCREYLGELQKFYEEHRDDYLQRYRNLFILIKDELLQNREVDFRIDDIGKRTGV